MSALVAGLLLMSVVGQSPSGDLATEDTVQVGSADTSAAGDPALPWHLPPAPAVTPPPPPDPFASIVSIQARGMRGYLNGGLLAVQSEFSFGKVLVGLVGLGNFQSSSLSSGFSGMLVAAGLGGNIGFQVYEAGRLKIAVLGPELEGGASVTFGEDVFPWFDVGVSGLRVVSCPFKFDLRPRWNISHGSFGVSLDIGFL